MTAMPIRDLLAAKPNTYDKWLQRPWHEKVTEAVVLPLKSQL